MLHGVPVTLKINVDMAGHATTNRVAANKDKIAECLDVGQAIESRLGIITPVTPTF